MENVIYRKVIRTAYDLRADGAETVELTKEDNGFHVWHCWPTGPEHVEWFDTYNRDEAIEYAVDNARQVIAKYNKGEEE